MDPGLGTDRRTANDLTVLKLALGIMEGTTELSARQRSLLATALSAADRLADRWAQEADRTVWLDGRRMGNIRPSERGSALAARV